MMMNDEHIYRSVFAAASVDDDTLTKYHETGKQAKRACSDFFVLCVFIVVVVVDCYYKSGKVLTNDASIPLMAFWCCKLWSCCCAMALLA